MCISSHSLEILVASKYIIVSQMVRLNLKILKSQHFQDQFKNLLCVYVHYYEMFYEQKKTY